MDKETVIGGAIVYMVESSLGTSPLIIPQGPVLPWHNLVLAGEAWDILFKELNVLARQFRSAVLRVEPAVSVDMMTKFFPTAKRAPIDLVPAPSLLITINRPDKDILADMKPKGRYNIKQAAKHGVETVWEISTVFLEESYKLFNLTCLRHRFTGESFDFFVNLVEHLRTKNMLRIYLTRYRGVVTSTAIIILYGQTATYLYGGSLPFFPQTMSSYDLHWTAMKEARLAGCRFYDFYGIAPENQPFHPYAKFTNFKKKFGGHPTIHAGAYDIIFYQQLSALWLKQMDAMAVN